MQKRPRRHIVLSLETFFFFICRNYNFISGAYFSIRDSNTAVVKIWRMPKPEKNRHLFFASCFIVWPWNPKWFQNYERVEGKQEQLMLGRTSLGCVTFCVRITDFHASKWSEHGCFGFWQLIGLFTFFSVRLAGERSVRKSVAKLFCHANRERVTYHRKIFSLKMFIPSMVDTPRWQRAKEKI